MEIPRIESNLMIIVVFLLLASMSGCGSSTSIEKSENFVQYATVKVNADVQVNGRLIDANENIIAIVVDGALVQYDRESIEGYEIYMAPDSHLMQKDVVISTNATANNTGFFVVLTVISLVLAGISGYL